jgi:hypothetical protein
MTYDKIMLYNITSRSNDISNTSQCSNLAKNIFVKRQKLTFIAKSKTWHYLTLSLLKSQLCDS